MAVIVSNGATNLSTASGFYRAESYNIGMGTNVTALATTVTTQFIPVTFANAGNSKGLIISLRIDGNSANLSASTTTVALQEINTPVTLTIASPCVMTWNTAAPANGTTFMFTSTGSLPTGLTAGQRYFVTNSAGLTSNISLTSGGASINTSGSQSGTHTAWIDRATKTLTYAEMMNIPTSPTLNKYHIGDWIIPYEFATPYAVDTTASKWRFAVNGTDTAFQMGYSTAGNFMHVAWCDNAMTFTNNDTVVCKDIVTIDQTCTFGSTSPTGLATVGIAVLVTRSLSMTAANCKLQWATAPAASYTASFLGRIALGTHSGFSIGTAASPIPIAQKAILDFTTSTLASQSSINSHVSNGVANGAGKANLFWYGAIPSGVIRTTLNGAVANGAATITTTDSTGWIAGDIFTVGRPAQGGANMKYYTVSSVAGTVITPTVVIAGARSTGGQVIKLTGYGIKVNGPTSYGFCTNMNFTNLQLSGVEFPFVGASQSIFNDGYSNRYSTNSEPNFWDDPANELAENYCKNCSFYSTNASVGNAAFAAMVPFRLGFRIEDCDFHCIPPFYGWTALSGTNGDTGYVRLIDNRWIHYNNGSTGVFGFITASSTTAMQAVGQLDIEDNICEGSLHTFFNLSGLNLIHKNNSYWGGGTIPQFGDAGAVNYGQLFNVVEISGNQYNANACGVCLLGNIISGAIETNALFGNISANTKDVMQKAGGLVDFEFANPVTVTNYSTTDLSYVLNGTNIKFTTKNGTTNNDSGNLKYGYFQRTGSGLSDTTVHTAGGTAMRFESTSSTNNLQFQFKVPTGNIQNRTMTMAVWVKINTATYYAGTHQLPRLTINYDNGTIAYSQAGQSTAWQLLFVSFTPTTTFGEIVTTLSTRTDATGSSAYVYWDDMAVQYPAGYQLDLGALDIWAHALPVTPPIATNLSALSVWTAPSTTDYGSSTMGEKVTKKILTTSKFIGLK